MICPCKDCLVFIICKNRYIKKTKYITYFSFIEMFSSGGCDLYREWYHVRIEDNMSNEEITLRIFGLVK